jgi:signal transduction histidine kinase
VIRLARLTLQRAAVYSFELLVALLLLTEGISFIFGAPKPGSVDTVFPYWLRSSWGMILLFASVFVIIGVVVERRFLHAAGMWLIAGVALFYAIAVIDVHHPGYPVTAISDIALAGAAVSRAVNLQQRRR